MASTGNASYIIVGAGVFGTPTALHLITKYPNASIALVDRHAPDAPTRDIWRTDPLWKTFYHESGIYWISRSGFAKQVIDNFKQLGRTAEVYSLPVAEARKLYGGLFDEADYTGVKHVLINKTSGWADAKSALQAVIEEAVRLGVKYVTAEADKLEFDEEGGGACTGIRTSTGRSLTATHTILSTGAFTPKLLEKTADATGRDAFRAGDRIVAAGVTTGLATLDEETARVFASMPVCIQENPPERGASNGTLPLNKDRQLKWWGQYIFRNTQETPAGRQISAPPPDPDYAQWDVPDVLKKDVGFANRVTFGKRGAADAVTPSEDFIISPHPAASGGGLYVATCGSFHGWKFFPVIGDYVVRMLEGELEADLVERWAWDRALPDPRGNVVWPRKELKDLQ
ncbi:Uu.00g115980.m01.CDS01 [Anthostomella pinea]|uniref:Uu.00g115980.m01.CDS01 n=1 Tax=Anthostomella pinea TaxID=933095 RepID=A0AAI8VFX2_9PEZI|nr:Uu.00g115980.m01.CDS01 [Anthostomella pinea]